MLQTRTDIGYQYIKLYLNMEYVYNGAGLDRPRWDALGSGPGNSYLQYRNEILNQQELSTRQALFVYANWQNALIRHLDLMLMLRINTTDHSRMGRLEACYAIIGIGLIWWCNCNSRPVPQAANSVPCRSGEAHRCRCGIFID